MKCEGGRSAPSVIKSILKFLLMLPAGLALAAEPQAGRLTADRATPTKPVAQLSKTPGCIRVATFNVSLAGDHQGHIRERLQGGNDAQARAVAEILQAVDADVVLLNELDYDASGEVLKLLRAEYLCVPQNCCALKDSKSRVLDYPYWYSGPVNTGVASSFDLDRDGRSQAEVDTNDYARDAWGYGRYPGQYGMAVLSKYPIDVENLRTFQHFLWKDMPGAQLPRMPDAPEEGWYSAEILAELPLSSKSHWDVPVRVERQTLHLLCSHPTPPVFDGPEDRNGRRNHDEIRFWADYLRADKANYIVDDRGTRGGLRSGPFVILGDLNSDPHDPAADRAPILQLLEHPQIASDFVPKSAGALEQATLQAGANAAHRGDPAADTGDFGDKNGPGNLRLDYVLPSQGTRVAGGGVYWPAPGDEQFGLVGAGFPIVSSDHRLVWLDIELPTQQANNSSHQ